jgi:hypothetical protein
MHRLGAVALFAWLALAGSWSLVAPGSLSELERSPRSAMGHALPSSGLGIGASSDASPGPETEARSGALLARPAAAAPAAGARSLGSNAVHPRQLQTPVQCQRGPPASLA